MCIFRDLALSWIISAGLALGPVRPVSAAPPQSSAEAPARADEFAEAEQLYVNGELLGAIEAYARLYLRTGEPVCLANLGRLHEERGEPELAAQYYRRFLLHPRASEGQREQVRERLRALVPDELALPVALVQPGPTTPAPEGPPPPPPSRRRLQVGGGVLLALGVPGLAAGGVLAGQVLQLHEELRGVGFQSGEERQETADAATGRRGLGIGLLVGGALALVAGVTLLAVGGRRAARASAERRITAQPAGLILRF
jgi:hypothetical protein